MWKKKKNSILVCQNSKPTALKKQWWMTESFSRHWCHSKFRCWLYSQAICDKATSETSVPGWISDFPARVHAMLNVQECDQILEGQSHKKCWIGLGIHQTWIPERIYGLSPRLAYTRWLYNENKAHYIHKSSLVSQGNHWKVLKIDDL